MPYAYLSFAAARAIVANRLEDPTFVYWSAGEIDSCIREAVRLHQCATGAYKQRVTLPLTAGPFYDLTALGALAYSVTDVQVINDVLSALLEPALSPGWTGTGQFTFAQLQNALQHRLNRFLGDTGCVVTPQTIPGPTPPSDLAPLPDPTLDVRRVAWIQQPASGSTGGSPGSIVPPNQLWGGAMWGAGGTVIPPTPPTPAGAEIAYALDRMDEWAAQTYVPDAAQNPVLIPADYSVYGVPPIQIRIIPPPSLVKQLELLLVMGGVQVNLDTTAPVVLGIPDDLTPALKWGVLADVLSSDGQSRDHARAMYCEQRYSEFVQMAPLYAALLTADVNGITSGVTSIQDLDAYLPDWEQTIGPPFMIGTCGRNIVCAGPQPDGASAYTAGLWVAATMPVTGNIQIGRDQLDPVLDYAQHIACFKMGGWEFDSTQRMFQNMITALKQQNSRLNAVSFYRSQLEQPAIRSELLIPRLEVKQ